MQMTPALANPTAKASQAKSGIEGIDSATDPATNTSQVPLSSTSPQLFPRTIQELSERIKGNSPEIGAAQSGRVSPHAYGELAQVGGSSRKSAE